MTQAIYQFVAGYTHGDAISNEARILQKIFRSWGEKSEIFCDHLYVRPELRHEVIDINSASKIVKEEDIVLLHLSIGSRVNELFREIKAKKAILYHNITPSHYFNVVNPQVASALEKGIIQVRALKGVAEVNMADSEFNAAELLKYGYSDVKVLPLVLDLDSIIKGYDRTVFHRFKDGLVNILFVGRCVPNKKIEDLIILFGYIQKYILPSSRLIVAGSYEGMEAYYQICMTLVRDIGLRNVYFSGWVTQSVLNAFYRVADLFVCMSEHEGFCIPVIEAMAFGIPVIAYAGGAVPETMDGAGVIFFKKSFELIAETVGEIVKNKRLRNAIIIKQNERIERYKKRNLSEELKSFLSPLMI